MHRSSVAEVVNRLLRPSDHRPALLARTSSAGRSRSEYRLLQPSGQHDSQPSGQHDRPTVVQQSHNCPASTTDQLSSNSRPTVALTGPSLSLTRDSLSQSCATHRRQRPWPARRRRGTELSRPNAQRQQRQDADRLDPVMCEERRPRATASRCVRRHLVNAAESRRRRPPQMPTRCHQRPPRRTVRRVHRGCEGRIVNARVPQTSISHTVRGIPA